MGGIGALALAMVLLAATLVAQDDCQKGESVKLQKGLQMVCTDRNTWEPREGGKRNRVNPGGPPCQDSVDTCQADRGHCNQYTERGAEMERVCPGTCDSCDGCRCQDNSQWHKYCPYWAQYCSSTGVLGSWMMTNCRKTCKLCKCNCCSYKGKSHKLGERILLPEQCGELVCEEGLVAGESPLLPGAVLHDVSHPDELTLVFHSLHPGSECCLVNNTTMVAEGWAGEVVHEETNITATCCHGVLSVPIAVGMEAFMPKMSRDRT